MKDEKKETISFNKLLGTETIDLLMGYLWVIDFQIIGELKVDDSSIYEDKVIKDMLYKKSFDFDTSLIKSVNIDYKDLVVDLVLYENSWRNDARAISNLIGYPYKVKGGKLFFAIKYIDINGNVKKTENFLVNELLRHTKSLDYSNRGFIEHNISFSVTAELI